MSILLDKRFASIAFSHFIIDTLNGQRGILLAFLSVPLALSNTTVGLVSSFYMIAAALIQPLTGWLTDKAGPRWLVAGGALWMGFFFALALVVPGNTALVLLVVASLGSGMFHPAGSMQSTLMGRTHLAGRESTAASYFFFFGQSGYFIGPLIGGPLLSLWGLPGLLILVVFCLPVAVFGGWQLRRAERDQELPEPAAIQGTPSYHLLHSQWRLVALLLVIATSQSWIQLNMQTFIPKYLNDLGELPTVYGFIAALYMGGSALGNVFGGHIADRIGGRVVILTGLVLLSIPVFLITLVGTSAWLYILVPVSGLFSGAAYTSIFVRSQHLIPGARGLAAGIALSFIFSSGSIGGLISGVIADRYGFIPVFILTAGLGLLGGLFALGLKQDRPVDTQNSLIVSGISRD